MVYRVYLLLITGGVLVAAATMPAHAASFDCAKAHKTDEAAICKNPDLSELDTEMGALWFAYSRVPFLMGSNAARHDDANDFLGKRSACGGDLACLRPLYQARIHALKEDIDRAMNNVLREENASPSGPALPPAIQTIIVGYADQCRQLGGTLSAEDNSPLIMTGDFDGDGKPDYVLNPQNLRCSAAATAFCGNGGCQITIALSGKGYQEPITVLGGQPTLIQRSDGTDVDVWVDSSNCKLQNKEKACWVSYSWKDGKVNESYRARPLPD